MLSILLLTTVMEEEWEEVERHCSNKITLLGQVLDSVGLNNLGLVLEDGTAAKKITCFLWFLKTVGLE